MIRDFISNWLQKQNYGVTIYPVAYFDLRIQEEMIRADESKSFFVYAEIEFGKVNAFFKDESLEKEFWVNFLKCIAIKDRGSDVLGFLQDNIGLGLLMLDSKMEGWIRLRGRIKEFCRRPVGDVSEILDSKVIAFTYPACFEKNLETESDHG